LGIKSVEVAALLLNDSFFDFRILVIVLMCFFEVMVDIVQRDLWRAISFHCRMYFVMP